MKIRNWSPAVITFVGLAALFELFAALEILNVSLFPPPSQVLKVLWELRQDFLIAFMETAGSVFLGFLISSFLGLLIAVAFSRPIPLSSIVQMINSSGASKSKETTIFFEPFLLLSAFC